VYEFYDKLVLIWGGSANTEPLPYGVTADDFLEENSDEDDINYDAIDKEIQQDHDSVQNCGNIGNGAMAKSSVVIPSKRKGNCTTADRQQTQAPGTELICSSERPVAYSRDSKFKRDLTNVMRQSSDKFAEC